MKNILIHPVLLILSLFLAQAAASAQSGPSARPEGVPLIDRAHMVMRVGASQLSPVSADVPAYGAVNLMADAATPYGTYGAAINYPIGADMNMTLEGHAGYTVWKERVRATAFLAYRYNRHQGQALHQIGYGLAGDVNILGPVNFFAMFEFAHPLAGPGGKRYAQAILSAGISFSL